VLLQDPAWSSSTRHPAADPATESLKRDDALPGRTASSSRRSATVRRRRILILEAVAARTTRKTVAIRTEIRAALSAGLGEVLAERLATMPSTAFFIKRISIIRFPGDQWAVILFSLTLFPGC
jgi:hypothetical protein